MDNKLTLEDLIGFVGDDARPGKDVAHALVWLSPNDAKRLRPKKYTEWLREKGIAIGSSLPGGQLELADGTIVLLEWSNTEIRRHSPGDPMPWREKQPACAITVGGIDVLAPPAPPANDSCATISFTVVEYEYKTVLYWTDGPGDDGQSEPTPSEADGWKKVRASKKRLSGQLGAMRDELTQAKYTLSVRKYRRPIPQPPERVYEHCPSDTPLRGDWPKTGRPSGPVGRGEG
jgi:hypothetical protein